MKSRFYWEKIVPDYEKTASSNPLLRVWVPQGWLVRIEGIATAVHIPDPDHEWLTESENVDRDPSTVF